MLSRLEISKIVFEEIEAELVLDGDHEVPTDPALCLMDEVGLNSLMVASLLIALEERIGIDPFTRDIGITDISTIADLIRAYEKTLSETLPV